jgi:mRNA interferase RelE/StbE
VNVIKIKYAKIALKALNKYDAPTRQFIREKIKGLTETPPVGDIKPLTSYENQYRLRAGKYRILYEYIIQKDLTILMINKIDSRGGIYKE